RDKRVRLQATKPDGARVLGLPARLLGRAASASFALAESLDRALPGVPELLAANAGPEAIWMCRAPDVDAPLEALTHLLAATIARDFDESTAILAIGESGPRLSRWDGGGFVGLPFGSPETAVTEGAIA